VNIINHKVHLKDDYVLWSQCTEL